MGEDEELFVFDRVTDQPARDGGLYRASRGISLIHADGSATPPMRAVSPMFESTSPGQSSETPTPNGRRYNAKLSVSPTTPNLAVM